MNLEQKIKQSGYRKSDLAKHFGVHWNTVNNWCKKPMNLKLSLINDINEFLEQ